MLCAEEADRSRSRADVMTGRSEIWAIACKAVTDPGTRDESVTDLNFVTKADVDVVEDPCP